MPNVNELLIERGATHGDFKENSRIAQEIKVTIRSGLNYPHLQPFHIEALDMIAHKIGRILAGDPVFQDHWDDLAGYAKLASERNKEIK